MTVESALVDGSDWWAIDWSKWFDRVPQGIAFKLAERQGIHPSVLQPLRGMYPELRTGAVMVGHVQPRMASSKAVSERVVA